MAYKGQVTVLELKSHRWRAVHVRGIGHTVEVVSVNEVESPADEDIGAWVKELTTRKFPTGNIVLLLDGESSSLRYHSVPPVPSWRLDLILHYEIEEIAEKTGDALSGGHIELLVPESLSEDTLLLLGVGKDSVIQPLIDQIREGHGQVKLALPSAIGTFHGHLASHGPESEDQTVLLCDVQETETQVLVVRENRLLFARSVGFGLQGMVDLVTERTSVSEAKARQMIAAFVSGDLIDGEEAMVGCHRGWTSQLGQMLTSSLSFCKAQLKIDDVIADRVLLSGIGAELVSRCDQLRRLMDKDLEVVSFAGTAGSQWTLNIGTAAAALDSDDRIVDLLPTAERKRRTFRDHTRFLWAGVAALVLAVGLQAMDVSVSAARATGASQTIRQWRGDISNWRSAEEDARKSNDVFRKRETRIIQEIETGKFYSKILDRLRQDLPSEISLEQISLRRVVGDSEIGIEIELIGQADNSRRNGLEAIETLQGNLEGIPGVERVRSTPEDQKSGAYPFSILVSPDEKLPEKSNRGPGNRRRKSPFGGRG
ncbi:MAG: hypothetical protein OSB09_00900 [Planctomycetota bacterium]|nr:hypothetical protein [Planctomycetota bacterium]